ncbi:hypothetical protein [Bowmanella dokdonensis]|uniref:Uncharacterized protein n=1 Tax=Bowmanella dokdonensis TaxID=751969 RepID=A0A939DMY4_9ALTE|nr:hypothetical protein [Bowmanella dokdonensis]MBN7824751.1 hypothetical protein [Bowmanella dokdonensis]
MALMINGEQLNEHQLFQVDDDRRSASRLAKVMGLQQDTIDEVRWLIRTARIAKPTKPQASSAPPQQKVPNMSTNSTAEIAFKVRNSLALATKMLFPADISRLAAVAKADVRTILARMKSDGDVATSPQGSYFITQEGIGRFQANHPSLNVSQEARERAGKHALEKATVAEKAQPDTASQIKQKEETESCPGPLHHMMADLLQEPAEDSDIQDELAGFEVQPKKQLNGVVEKLRIVSFVQGKFPPQSQTYRHLGELATYLAEMA